MDRKSLEFHKYKLEIYKRRGMTASVILEEAAIYGIEYRDKVNNDKHSKGLERVARSRVEVSCN